MDKYIGMDMDSKKIAVCVVDSKGQECHATLKPELGAVRCFIERQKSGGYRVGVAYEISGQAGWWYDNLSDVADEGQGVQSDEDDLDLPDKQEE